uniref:Uncharacterized protein n=1 Tax=Arundo donax TaxID=35708 RepID=A0A0A9TDJ8_ARUDO
MTRRLHLSAVNQDKPRTSRELAQALANQKENILWVFHKYLSQPFSFSFKGS